jgi:hypothetical protein
MNGIKQSWRAAWHTARANYEPIVVLGSVPPGGLLQVAARLLWTREMGDPLPKLRPKAF